MTGKAALWALPSSWSLSALLGFAVGGAGRHAPLPECLVLSREHRAYTCGLQLASTSNPRVRRGHLWTRAGPGDPRSVEYVACFRLSADRDGLGAQACLVSLKP